MAINTCDGCATPAVQAWLQKCLAREANKKRQQDIRQ